MKSKSLFLVTIIKNGIMTNSFAGEWKVDFKKSLPNMDTPGVVDSVSTYVWGLELLCTFICIILFMFGAKKLSNNHYVSALMSFFGGAIAGISPYLAKVFLY